MVDPEDVALDECAEQHPIQLASRRQVLAEWLLDHHARAGGAARLRQLLDDRTEQRRRNRQVVRRLGGAAELAAERRKGRRILVVAVDVLKLREKLVEGRAIDAAVLLDAVARARPQLLEIPPGLGHADHRHVELPSPGQRLQGRKDLLYARSPVAPKNTSASDGVDTTVLPPVLRLLAVSIRAISALVELS